MIQQQILAIPPAVQAEIDYINALLASATRAERASMVDLIAKRDALMAQREPRPIAIGEQF